MFLNPHCQEFVVKRYREFLPDYKAPKNRHVSQVLVEAFQRGQAQEQEDGRSRSATTIRAFWEGVWASTMLPDEVLAELKGVKLVEMARNRASSFCCGARALGNYYPDMSAATARERVQEFKDTGADVLVTACQYCKDRFQKVLPAGEKGRESKTCSNWLMKGPETKLFGVALDPSDDPLSLELKRAWMFGRRTCF